MGKYDESAQAAKIKLAGEIPRAKKLSEFVYGVIMAMVALAPFIEHSEGTNGLAVSVAVVGGSAAIWLAHAYSELIGERATAHYRFGLKETWRFLRQSLPIVEAGFLIAVPILLSVTGLWSLSTGLTMANALGLISLAGIGIAIGVIEEASPAVIVWNAAFAVGIGAIIILLERAVHHLG